VNGFVGNRHAAETTQDEDRDDEKGRSGDECRGQEARREQGRVPERSAAQSLIQERGDGMN